MKRKVGWYRRLSQALRLPLAGPLFRLYAPRKQWQVPAAQGLAPQILIANLMPSLGDTICYMALVEAIRDAIPQAEITWMADGALAKLIAQHPDVDHVLTIRTPPSRLENIPAVATYYRVFQLMRSIRNLQLSQRFDAAIVPRGGVDPSFSAHAVWMLNLPTSAGYSHQLEGTDTEHAFPDSLFTHVESRIVTLHESARAIHLLSLTHLVPDALQRFNQYQSLRGLAFIAAQLDAPSLLHRLGVPVGVPFVVLSPFAGVPRREWPAEKFRELAGLILKETGSHVVLTGTSKDLPISESIRKDLGDRVLNTSGNLDLQQLITLISYATAFVGNDSGAGHIAGALGIPVISLHVHAEGADPFHKSSPEQCMPLGPQVTILRPKRFLAPCEFRCESETVHCLAQISVEEVWQALRDALQLASVRSTL